MSVHDAEIAKLERAIARMKEGDVEARATQAAIYLRKACELVADLPSHVDVVGAGEHMVKAAEILGAFKLAS